MPRSAVPRRDLLPRVRALALRGGVSAWRRLAGDRVARLYHYDVILRTNNFDSTSWMGVPIWQNVLDLWTIQETIAELKPALIVETGTHRGGSALFYAQLLDLIGGGRVLTIDIVDKRDHEHPRVSFLHGSSTDPEIVAQVRAEAASTDGHVMVILDGDHSREHVAAELELYAPLVSEGSYLLSQDGVIDQVWFFGDTRPGPLPANREFLARHPEFEYDAERNERFGLTHHPLGWMRRREL